MRSQRLEYDYSVTWMRKAAVPAEVKGSEDKGVIFVDQIPETGPAGATGS